MHSEELSGDAGRGVAARGVALFLERLSDTVQQFIH